LQFSFTSEIWAHFLPRCGKKPGFPLQFLGFAYANPVGFPLQSGCMGEQRFCFSKIVTSPLAPHGLPESGILCGTFSPPIRFFLQDPQQTLIRFVIIP
jgi:hypothetical protein